MRVAAGGLGGAIAWLVKPVMDGIFISRDVTMLKLVPLAILGVSVIKGAAGYGEGYFIAAASERAGGQAPPRSLRSHPGHAHILLHFTSLRRAPGSRGHRRQPRRSAFLLPGRRYGPPIRNHRGGGGRDVCPQPGAGPHRHHHLPRAGPWPSGRSAVSYTGSTGGPRSASLSSSCSCRSPSPAPRSSKPLGVRASSRRAGTDSTTACWDWPSRTSE